MFRNTILSMLLFSILLPDGQAQSLDEYRWKNRLVLLFAPESSSDLLQQQVELLTADSEKVTDRGLLLFSITPNGGTSPGGTRLSQKYCRQLYADWAVLSSSFTIILVGKDGGEKLRKQKVTAPQVLFDLIDSMPMRRAEMRRKH
jgi:hypothetical protein